MGSVVVLPYHPEWPALFDTIRQELLSVFSGCDVCVEHIGSTSVTGLSAKPVIDVLLGAASLAAIEAMIPGLRGCGYEYRQRYEQEVPERRYFVRASSRVPRVHIHAVEVASPIWRNHLAFRDALRNDQNLANEYQALKIRLSEEHPDDKERYTSEKGPFIKRVIALRVRDAG